METQNLIRSRRYEEIRYERTDDGVVIHDRDSSATVKSIEDVKTSGFSTTQKAELRKVFNHEEKECKQCGSLFACSRDASYFCSIKCQQKYYIAHMQRALTPKRSIGVCRQCGAPLPGNRRTYCSDKCAKAAKRESERSASSDFKTSSEEPKKLTKRQRERRFQRAVAEANRSGLSYGQYKAKDVIDKYARVDLHVK